MNICSLLKFQVRPLVRRVKGGFVKLNFKVAFPKEKKLPSFTKEVLSIGDFVKPAPVVMLTKMLAYCHSLAILVSVHFTHISDKATTPTVGFFGTT